MKKLLLFGTLAFGLNAFGQQTYVPDDNFEAYLEANGMGNGIPNDDYVTTANIVGVTHLNLFQFPPSDLTGIEEFTALTTLAALSSNLTSLDVSQNTFLDTIYVGQSFSLSNINVGGLSSLKCLDVGECNLSSIDVSDNTSLEYLSCYNNNLAQINVSQNTALKYLDVSNQTGQGNAGLTYLDLSNNTNLIQLYCGHNSITTLDFSQNTLLQKLDCRVNHLVSIDVSMLSSLVHFDCQGQTDYSLPGDDAWVLECLNVKNGNNYNMVFNLQEGYGGMIAGNNGNLSCIQVDDPNWSNTASGWIKNPSTIYSLDCGNPCSASISELSSLNKELIKITNLFGQETEFKPNTPLIYIYSDGSTERVMQIEE